MKTFDVERARRDTRASSSIIHFNNAGASLMPAPVSDALHTYLHNEEARGGYETAAGEEAALNNFYTAFAKLLNCHPQEIAYAENATRAWDMAFYSFKFERGDKILTTLSEYGSNVIAYLQQAKRYGVELVFVPNDAYGQIDTSALQSLIDARTKLISINHIPTGGGLVNPAREVGRIANAAGVPYLLDACQSLGQIPVDVEEIGCDMLSSTGRKYLRGPRGTGLLYVRTAFAETLVPPMLDQHAALLTSPNSYTLAPGARRFENWEQYFAGKVALGVAADYALSWGLEAIQTRVYALADLLRANLSDLSGVSVTDDGKERCGIVTFTAEQLEPKAIKAKLAERNINVSTSEGSGSLVSFSERGLSEVVRASLHYFNTVDEIEQFKRALENILKV